MCPPLTRDSDTRRHLPLCARPHSPWAAHSGPKMSHSPRPYHPTRNFWRQQAVGEGVAVAVAHTDAVCVCVRGVTVSGTFCWGNTDLT